jgi:type I restriction-modification system DNA methylase subunit
LRDRRGLPPTPPQQRRRPSTSTSSSASSFLEHIADTFEASYAELAAQLIETHPDKLGDILIYGHKNNYTTWLVAKMNLVIRGIGG